MRFLLIDDDELDRAMITRSLTRAFRDCVIDVHVDTSKVKQALNETEYDCVLLDYRLPSDDGLEFLSSLGHTPRHELPPFIMLTGMGDESIAVEAMKRGAIDYLRKDDAEPDMLRRSIYLGISKKQAFRRNAQQQQTLEILATVDALTGLGNRASFDADLAKQCKSGSIRPFGLIIVDLDGFKPINDRYGHLAGDVVLRSVGSRLLGAIREVDTAYRIGGDEFAVMVDATESPELVMIVGERIGHIFDTDFEFEGQRISCAASIGIALCPDHASNGYHLIEQADAAMYLAKRDGPRVRIAGGIG